MEARPLTAYTVRIRYTTIGPAVKAMVFEWIDCIYWRDPAVSMCV